MRSRVAVLRSLVGLSLGLAVGCSGTTSGSTASSTASTAADKQQITTLINSPQLQPFLPNGITSDGGVVFATSDTTNKITSDGAAVFLTKGLNTNQAGPGAPPAHAGPPPLPSRHPNRYGRNVTKQQPLQIDIQFDSAVLNADATVTSVNSGDLSFEPAEDAGHLYHKTYQEQNVRNFQFIKSQGSWKLARLSPIQTTPGPAVTSPVQITRMVLWVNGQVLHTYDNNSATETDIDALPVLHNGDQVKVEVSASNSDGTYDPPLFVYLRRPGSGVHEHLLDDGNQTGLSAGQDGGSTTSGDTTAGDGVYTRSFTLNSAKGIYHITSDAISADSINVDDDSTYHSVAFSIAVQVN